MAANYWASTQKLYWQFSREALLENIAKVEAADSNLVQQYGLPERRLLSIFFREQLVKLGKRMNVRQQAIATAQIYIRRFYVKVEIRRTNPYVVIATALYLACKIEECQHHIRVVMSEAKNLWPDFIGTEVSKVGECEFYLISELSCQLIVHHPYRTILELHSTLAMAQDEMTLSWSIINDHYMTDIPLLFAPHVAAVTAIFLALVLKPTHAGLQVAASSASSLASAVQNARDGSAGDSITTTTPATPQARVQHLITWLAESDIDIKAMANCTQEIISLYVAWDQYSEKTCKEQIGRFVKARNLDK